MFPSTLLLRSGTVSETNPQIEVELVSSDTSSATYNALLYATATPGYFSTVVTEDDPEVSTAPFGTITLQVRSSNTSTGPSQSYARKRHNVLITVTEYGVKSTSDGCDHTCPDKVSTISTTLIRDKSDTATTSLLEGMVETIGHRTAIDEAIARHL